MSSHTPIFISLLVQPNSHTCLFLLFNIKATKIFDVFNFQTDKLQKKNLFRLSYIRTLGNIFHHYQSELRGHTKKKISIHAKSIDSSSAWTRSSYVYSKSICVISFLNNMCNDFINDAVHFEYIFYNFPKILTEQRQD